MKQLKIALCFTSKREYLSHETTGNDVQSQANNEKFHHDENIQANYLKLTELGKIKRTNRIFVTYRTSLKTKSSPIAFEYGNQK
ncbi:hypothetical protein [Vibrio genomosp. F10]|uniref:hypothetical protein n=1 Tax=Vibrio genomosp. F10 TaxID=723171 RepID=UPI000361C058|nr:hypothetical protein [Vibrio genomosp. F10]OEF09724.1 hypothetical protein A1QI_13570 [Vibrio genomosp. F10 str. 9ZB36]